MYTCPSLLLSILAILVILGKMLTLHLLTCKLFFAPYLVLRRAVLEECRRESSPSITDLPAFQVGKEVYNSACLVDGQLYLLASVRWLLLGVEFLGMRAKNRVESIATDLRGGGIP